VTIRVSSAAGQPFLRLVHERGYWLARPEENSVIGLNTNWDG
jgi:hypothetical protein